ncbi:PfkB family carbohydrate kinase [Ectothiorhodospira lacustris]|uniref:PfkB family carbohydrate kinase n=1 Tax=Ectothiorhodospira lacustris TaxID=2899127 RepID=UPI001EE9950B|nr:PfkB family carbohydrate kinase [Ectothiorhodospira lacustris]MCG5509715.1 PfkB family carbohydrate kinase [Ectothiorhodospira lacustris]MCG5523052.1 PfkB family carbohydrate kinase [Ectothiorhodospira lacustris]
MAHILGIGVATLDIINIVDHYPVEDEEIRAREQRACPGGNTANSLYVLQQLGHQCDLAAVVADDPDGEYLLSLLGERGINVETCRRRTGRTPCSYITLNAANGSRTIVHYRNLPELDAPHVAKLNLDKYQWVHVQARDTHTTSRMLQALRSQQKSHQPISLEVEKDRDGVDMLFGQPDVIIFSRPFVLGRGYEEPEPFLRSVHKRVPGAVLICTWGEEGSWAWASRDGLFHAPAWRPPRVVDTLGAGDVFNAGLIHALATGSSVPEALATATRLAGYKVGRQGLDGLDAALIVPEED